MGLKRLTIVVLTYKDKDGFVLTMDSLKNVDVTAILIVDGSRNGSYVDSYLLENVIGPSVRVLKGCNDGIYTSMNIALDNVKTELVWFLNGGDYIKGHLSEFLLTKSTLLRVEYGNKDNWSSREWKSPLKGAPYCHQGLIYDMSFLKYYSTKHYVFGDYIATVQYLLKGGSFYGSNDAVVYYDSTGISSRKSRRYYISLVKSFLTVYALYIRNYTSIQRK